MNILRCLHCGGFVSVKRHEWALCDCGTWTWWSP